MSLTKWRRYFNQKCLALNAHPAHGMLRLMNPVGPFSDDLSRYTSCIMDNSSRTVEMNGLDEVALILTSRLSRYP